MMIYSLLFNIFLSFTFPGFPFILIILFQLHTHGNTFPYTLTILLSVVLQLPETANIKFQIIIFFFEKYNYIFQHTIKAKCSMPIKLYTQQFIKIKMKILIILNIFAV